MEKKLSRKTTRHEFVLTMTAVCVLIAGAPFLTVKGQSATAAAPQSEVDQQRRQKKLVALMDEERLFARGQRRAYEGEHLTGISLPVGGIAAGPIQINGEGRRHIWQIFKNYKGLALPNSFFAVRAKADNATAVVRALQTVREGSFQPMKALRFSGEYPFGWFTFEDPTLPVEVRMEVFSPLIPLNERDSAIPCAIFNLTARNTGRKRVEVSFLATQQNAVGIQTGHEVIEGSRCDAYGGNRNRIQRSSGATMLHMTAGRPATSLVFGDLALAAVAPKVTDTASWESREDLYRRFSEDGVVSGPEAAGPSPNGRTINGALAAPFALEPGEEQTVSFVLAWHFPNAKLAPGHQGNRYAGWWDDALAVVNDVTTRLNELTRQTRLYHDTFYASNLPWWLLDRISSQVAILSSQTCNWDTNGFFYCWEGCCAGRGCCSGNATHVWGYAQAHARLFPAIGRAMREEDAASLRPDGMLPVRFVNHFPAFDGQCHFVISAYREHLLSADDQWIQRLWPKVKQAMDYAIIRWDAAGTPSRVEQKEHGIPDGMLSGPQHAMDGDQSGTSSWLGGMYLAALAAAEKMAVVVGDSVSAGYYGAILERGSLNQDRALFDGEYFIQLPDRPPLQDYLTGCYIDQMLGQWWARQLGCGWLYPAEHVSSAMRSLFRYNFRPDFHGIQQRPRKFVDDNDAGMVQCTWPKSDRPGSHMHNEIGYADEVMSGFEYSAAGLMVSCGLLQEAFTVLHAAADRDAGRLRTGLRGAERGNSAWGYSGNPFGDDECGKFYARAMSIWSVLLACQGFEYDGPAGRIGFAPVWRPEDHISFFTAAQGWGIYSQRQEANGQHHRIELKYGQLDIREMTYEVQKQQQVDSIQVKLDGALVAAEHDVQGCQVSVSLQRPVLLRPGQELHLQILFE